MEILALSILIVLSVLGFVAIFFTAYGTLVILIGAVLYALLTDFSILGAQSLIILILLYLCGEILEYVFIIIGAKKFGASNMAIVGAVIGGILGAVFGAGLLGVGLVLGTFLGIFLGAFLVEYIIQGDLVKSLKAGLGGVLGRVGSIAVKAVIGIIMIALIALRISLKP